MIKCIVIALVAVSFAFSFALPAAHAAVPISYSFSGQTAWASFNDSQGCISTGAYVNAVDGRVKTDGRPDVQSFAYVGVYQYDNCTDTLLGAYDCAADLSGDALQVAATLKTATLQLDDVPCYNYVTGETATADVTISWTCTGNVFSSTSLYQYRQPGLLINGRNSGQFCDATAIGTITVDDISFTSTSTYASIGNVRSGEIRISH